MVDKKDILKEVMTLNDFTYKDICAITGRSESTVFPWLRYEREIDNGALLQLWFAIIAARLNMPRSLDRFKNNMLSKGILWAKKHKSDNDKAVYVGDRANAGVKYGQFAHKYIYNGQALTLNEIAIENKIARNRLYQFLKSNNKLHSKADIFSDVEILKSKKKREKKSTIQFSLHNKIMSLREISEQTGISYARLSRATQNIDNNTAIDDLIRSMLAKSATHTNTDSQQAESTV